MKISYVHNDSKWQISRAKSLLYLSLLLIFVSCKARIIVDKSDDTYFPDNCSQPYEFKVKVKQRSGGSITGEKLYLLVNGKVIDISEYQDFPLDPSGGLFPLGLNLTEDWMTYSDENLENDGYLRYRYIYSYLWKKNNQPIYQRERVFYPKNGFELVKVGDLIAIGDASLINRGTRLNLENDLNLTLRSNKIYSYYNLLIGNYDLEHNKTLRIANLSSVDDIAIREIDIIPRQTVPNPGVLTVPDALPIVITDRSTRDFVLNYIHDADHPMASTGSSYRIEFNYYIVGKNKTCKFTIPFAATIEPF